MIEPCPIGLNCYDNPQPEALMISGCYSYPECRDIAASKPIPLNSTVTLNGSEVLTKTAEGKWQNAAGTVHWVSDRKIEQFNCFTNLKEACT